jgi:hypothetical protein
MPVIPLTITLTGGSLWSGTDMPAHSIFTVTDVSALDALQRYTVAQGLRGKDLIVTVRKVMKYLVSFAIAKIPKGDPEKIRAQLSRIVRTHERLGSLNVRGKNRAANQWRGTMAARVIFKLNWQDARLDAAFGDIEAYYKKAALFASRRRFAAGFHRSGLREAVLRLRAGSGAGRLPKFRQQPGLYDEQLSESLTGILVESWARAAGKDAKDPTQLYPDVFELAMPEVDRQFAKFLEADMHAAAVREGFTVKQAA